MCHAFLAKSSYQFSTTEALLDALRGRPRRRRLGGWESTGLVPSAPTFARAFTAFVREQGAQQSHAEVLRRHVGPKLVGQVSRDATALEAPEKPAPKPVPAPAASKQRGRPQRGEARPPTPPQRLELQPTRTLAEHLADLPTACAVGCKRNRKGHQESWLGYKLPLDVVEGDLPVSAVLTSASVPDPQVASPLAQLTAGRVTSLYDLRDSAYAAPQLHSFSRGLGPVPSIDPQPRGGEKMPLAPAEAQRFQERTAAERVNRRSRRTPVRRAERAAHRRKTGKRTRCGAFSHLQPCAQLICGGFENASQ